MCLKGVSVGEVLSLVAIIISIVSVWISISIASKQNKIALFQTRMNAFSKIENYVYHLSSWDFKYEWFLKLALSETQIKSLFNEKFYNFFVELDATSQKISELWGDYEHAKRKGDCRGKSEDEIDANIAEIAGEELKKFKEIKDSLFSKYLKL